MDYYQIFEKIYRKIEPFAKEGKQADYIPALAEVNPNQFGACILTVNGKQYNFKQSSTRFSIQSISKVFALAICLSKAEKTLWERVGKEPSGNAFNSLVQLELEKGIPRNPFINAGAIVMSDLILSVLRKPEKEFLRFIHALTGNETICYNLDLARSERSKGYMNAAIANLLKYHRNIENNIEQVLEFYFLTCSIEMNCEELAKAFIPFANHTQKFDYNNISLTASHVKRINSIMQTCGFYDEAGEFAYKVGLPGKSGVGGGIAAINPLRYSVAVWSPRLNNKGNSIMGMKALELLTTETQESIF